VGVASVFGRLWRPDPYGSYIPAYRGGRGRGGGHSGVCSVGQNNFRLFMSAAYCCLAMGRI